MFRLKHSSRHRHDRSRWRAKSNSQGKAPERSHTWESREARKGKAGQPRKQDHRFIRSPAALDQKTSQWHRRQHYPESKAGQERGIGQNSAMLHKKRWGKAEEHYQSQ